MAQPVNAIDFLTDLETFLNISPKTIEIEKRFKPCDEPIKIAVKSYKQTENGLDIEFYNIDDASLFWSNQDKRIELIFNPE